MEDQTVVQQRPRSDLNLVGSWTPDSDLLRDFVRRDDGVAPHLVLSPGAETDSLFIVAVPITSDGDCAGTASRFGSRGRVQVVVAGMRHWLSKSVPAPGTIQFYVPRIGTIVADVAGQDESQLKGYVNDPIVTVLVNLLVIYHRELQREAGPLQEKLLITLVRHVGSRYGYFPSEPLPAKGGLASWQMKVVREFVEANLSNELCMADIAKACNLSTCHFARAFRQSTGRPPHRWVAERRVHRAKSFLKDTALPLSEVALRCGFNDQSHFTRVFSSLVGTSPGRWRRAA